MDELGPSPRPNVRGRRLTEQPRLDVGRHVRDFRVNIPDLIERDVRDVGEQVGDITSRVGKLFGNVKVAENLVETLEYCESHKACRSG